MDFESADLVCLLDLKGSMKCNAPTTWFLSEIMKRTCENYGGSGIIALNLNQNKIDDALTEWLDLYQGDLDMKRKQLYLVGVRPETAEQIRSNVLIRYLKIAESAVEFKERFDSMKTCVDHYKTLAMPWELAKDNEGYLILHGRYSPNDQLNVHFQESFMELINTAPERASIVIYDIGLENAPPIDRLNLCLEAAVKKDIRLKVIAHLDSPLLDIKKTISQPVMFLPCFSSLHKVNGAITDFPEVGVPASTLARDIELREWMINCQINNPGIAVIAAEREIKKGGITSRKLNDTMFNDEVVAVAFFCPNVVSIDLESVKVLVNFKNDLASNGISLCLVNPSDELTKTLTKLRVSSQFAVVPDIHQLDLHHPYVEKEETEEESAESEADNKSEAAEAQEEPVEPHLI